MRSPRKTTIIFVAILFLLSFVSAELIKRDPQGPGGGPPAQPPPGGDNPVGAAPGGGNGGGGAAPGGGNGGGGAAPGGGGNGNGGGGVAPAPGGGNGGDAAPGGGGAAQPGGGNQPAAGGNPQGGNQPAAGGNPQGGNQPAAGGNPQGGNQPAAGGNTQVGNQPAAGGNTQGGNQPAAGGNPKGGNQPVIGGTGGNTTTGNNTNSPINPFGQTVQVQMTEPPPSQKNVLYRIGSVITFKWVYSYPFATQPKSISVYVQPSQQQGTLSPNNYIPVVTNTTFNSTGQQVIWNTGTTNYSLPMISYRLWICDQRGLFAPPTPGQLQVFNNLQFGLYTSHGAETDDGVCQACISRAIPIPIIPLLSTIGFTLITIISINFLML